MPFETNTIKVFYQKQVEGKQLKEFYQNAKGCKHLNWYNQKQ